MAQVYNPTATHHPSITVPDDGDAATAASVNTQGLKYLADNAAYNKQQTERKIDGVTGDDYTPTDPIVVRGDGMDVDPLVTGGMNVATELENARVATTIAAINWSSARNNYGQAGGDNYTENSQLVAVYDLFDSQDGLAFINVATGFVYYTYDGTTWDTSADSALTNMKGPVGGFVSSAGQTIVWDPSDGTVKKTSTFNTWQAAGTLTSTSPSLNFGAWAPVGTGGMYVIAGQGIINTSTSLAPVTWTAPTVPSGWTSQGPPSTPVCIAGGSNGFLIGTSGGGHVVYSADGVTWSFLLVATGVSVKSATYSEALQKWFVLTGSNKVYSAPNGAATWTELHTFGSGDVNVIKAFGRAIVAAGADSIRVSRDQGDTWTRLQDTYISDDTWGGWKSLCILNGCLVVAGNVFTDNGTGGPSDSVVEYRVSLREPFEFFGA